MIMPLGFTSSTYFPLEGDSLDAGLVGPESLATTWRKGFASLLAGEPNSPLGGCLWSVFC